jgi:hypothetical protein
VNTYSFLNVQASIVGPGGSFSIGSNSGAAEEGISTDMISDKDDMKVGAGGDLMHSLIASKAGRITIRLLKTSPVNKQLSDLYNFQSASSLLWGQNIVVVSDTVRGDVIAGNQMAFVRQAPVGYADKGNVNEWVFQGNVNEQLGSGDPVAS